MSKSSSNSQPIVWTIAGSDSGGGAGIQADLKTFNGLGVYGASVIAALTAQNTCGVNKVSGVPADFVVAQIDALKSDLPPVAVKLGMLYSTDVIDAVASRLSELSAFVICDPVMIATSGDPLIMPESAQTLIAKILPNTALLTPNLEEAHALLGKSIKDFEGLVSDLERDLYVESLGRSLLKLGPKAVLVKGGESGRGFSQDYWTDGEESGWLTSPYHDSTSTHGTGCTLSAAIASAVALGYCQLDALVIAKAYVNQGLRLAPGLGFGKGPLAHLNWPENEIDLPWLTKTASEGRHRLQFPSCGPEKLGFYPIVDDYGWMEKLLPLGVKTIQLRIKNLPMQEVDEQIRKASILARQYHCRLFVNDYWQSAIKHQSYGVHLGQDDLKTADLGAIEEAGLRLGVSTHCYREVARALALQPSYLAIGPIHATTTKEMKFAPQGVEAFKRWRRSLDYPLVAIGGIFYENAGELIEAGADSVAVVRDIVRASDLKARVNLWHKLFQHLPREIVAERKLSPTGG